MKRLHEIPTGSPLGPCGGAKYRWGIKITRFSTNKSLYIANDTRYRHSYYGEDIFIRFGATHERDRQTDRRTDGHRVTTYTALMHTHRAVKKSLFVPRFCFPWGRPWGNHARCCMDGKRIRILQIVWLHMPI